MEYRDTTREEQYQRAKEEKIQQKAESVHNQRSKTFNIVSHEGGGPRKINTMKRETRQERPYHLLSNLHNEDHEKAPLFYEEQYSLTKFRPAEVRAKTSIAKSREFNVVTNEYFKDHDTRRLEDFDKLKTQLLKKYWETHDFDIIKGRYFSPEKERQYQEQLEVLKKVHGKAQEARLPPSAKFADGNSYNIISQSCDDEEKFKVSQTMANRSMNRMKKLEKEAVMKDEGELRARRREELHLKNVSYKHWEKQMDRGYDFITNQVVANPPSPSIPRPATMWARLTTSSVDYSATNPATAPSERHAKTALFGSSSSAAITNSMNQANNDDLLPGMATSTRVRNLSGQGPRVKETSTAPPPISQRLEPATTRPITNATSARHPPSSAKVPTLNLSNTEFAEPVVYKEPAQGPPGLAIPIVRTGGLSAYQQ